MGILIGKYRIIWNNETKKILNDYTLDYDGSVTTYPDNNIESNTYPNNNVNSYFESNTYQDILDTINIYGLTVMTQPDPPIPTE